MLKTISTILMVVTLSTIAEGQQIDIHFDYSNADSTLALLADTNPAPGNLGQLLKMPDTAAVVSKRATRDASVTVDTYKQTLLDARGHRPLKTDPFQWEFCMEQIGNMRKLLGELHQHEAFAKARVAAAISPHLPLDMHLNVTVHFIIGGVSAGWESGASDFYIGLPFYKADIEGVIWTMQHELFHNAQAAGFHNQEKELVQLDFRQQEIYRLLDELFREGTATYVGHLGTFPPDAPFIKEMRTPAATNWERMSDNFALLDTLIFRLAHDPSVHFSDLQTLGFDWDWQNPLYYAGDAMTQQMIGKNGTLREYLQQSPVAFVRDYAAACGPASKCPYRLSADTVSSIFAIASRLHLPSTARESR